MAQDGGWPPGSSSTVRAQTGIIYIVRWCAPNLSTSGAVVSLSPPLLSHSIYRLSPAPILTRRWAKMVPGERGRQEKGGRRFSSSLYSPRAVCLSCSSTGSRFTRSLSIFHDSVFYCLYESFYPTFPPRAPLRRRHSRALRYVSRIYFYRRL